MKMFKKIFIFFLLLIAFSCNKELKKLPVSIENRYFHIPYCHSINITDLTNINEKIQKLSKASLRKKLGDSVSNTLVFKGAQILSDKPLSIIEKQGVIDILLYGNDSITNSDQKKCNFPYNYPVYKIYYSLKMPKVGIENIELEFIIDSKDSIIKNVNFPSYHHNKNIAVIPIDSVYSEIKRRSISRKNLIIDAWYSKDNDAIFWSVKTIISQGSILGGGCIPEIEYHFQINSKTGEITPFRKNNRDAYFLDRFNN